MSIDTVVLSPSVTGIYAGAFKDSQVRTVEVHSSIIYIEDGFEGSAVSEVKLLNSGLTSIVMPEGCTLSENITFYVHKSRLKLTRDINSEIADQIKALPE